LFFFYIPIFLMVNKMKNRFQEIDEKTQQELLKEVLRRANKREKQEHEQLGNRKTAIIERIVVLIAEYKELSEDSEKGKCPEGTAAQNKKPANEMSTEEFTEWMAQSRKESRESFEWSSRTLDVLKKQMVLIRELMELSVELCVLEREEKWLLPSVALRSQPNLLRFIEGGGNTR